MKTYLHIVVLLSLMVVGCARTVDDGAEEVVATPSLLKLSAIDSLMWRQPDSAFAVLRQFAASPKADSLDEFNGHYCQLLVAELLYKNDYIQSNRNDLMLAVDYFDSLTMDIHGVSVYEQEVFLDARAHYINGVGFYEQGDVVNACAEYLKTLEMMEAHFEEKELVKKKAIFMTYTYNRLMELFSTQFMMDPAIECGEKALMFCEIEPTSPEGISSILYQLGKQYDKIHDIDKARQYYEQALGSISNIDNQVFRDIVSSKALCDYKSGVATDSSLEELYYTLKCSDTEKERLNRYLTIGGIHFLERNYDSAIFYLEPVFEDNDAGLQAQAAGYLRIVYDSIGDVEKSNVYMRFLTNQKKPDGENKALVSKLKDMYMTYMTQEQEKQAEIERQKAVRRVRNIIVPIAVVVVLAVICVLILRNKKQLKIQQEEAERKRQQWMAKTKERHVEELEAERLAYEKEQETLRRSLKEREVQVSALEKSLNLQREKSKLRRKAFLKEPICQHILNEAKSQQITSRDAAHELGIALKDKDFEQLREAVEKHYEGFDHELLSQCPSLKPGLLSLCHLHLLGLNESEIAALKNLSYSAIKKQNESLQERLGVENDVATYILRMAEGLGVPQDVPQDVSQEITQSILYIVSHNPKITREEIAHQMGVSSKTVGRYLKKLDGRVRYVGSGYSGHWEVIE